MSRERPVELFLTRPEVEVLLRAVIGVIWEIDNDPLPLGSAGETQEYRHLTDLRRYLREALADEGERANARTETDP